MANNKKEIKVKFLRKIPTSEVKEDITKDGYTFAGYYETYYLFGKQIETIKKDAEKEKDICKEGFKLNSEKEKCVAEDKFDFKNTKIIKEKNIEALLEKMKKKKKNLNQHQFKRKLQSQIMKLNLLQKMKELNLYLHLLLV